MGCQLPVTDIPCTIYSKNKTTFLHNISFNTQPQCYNSEFSPTMKEFLVYKIKNSSSCLHE